MGRTSRLNSPGLEHLKGLKALPFHALTPMHPWEILFIGLSTLFLPQPLKFRKEGRSLTLPVIAIRADHDEARKEAHEAGADLSLRKPVELTLLFESLHRLMGVEFS